MTTEKSKVRAIDLSDAQRVAASYTFEYYELSIFPEKILNSMVTHFATIEKNYQNELNEKH